MRCYVLPTMPRKVDNYRADGQRSGTTPARGVNEEIYTLQRIQCQEGGYMSLQEPWQLDGNAEEWYERYLVPAIFGPWAADLVALAGHVSPAAAAVRHEPFALGDAETLRALVVGAGFGEVIIRPVVKVLRFPSAEAFVQRYIAGAGTLAQMVAQADDQALAALLR